MTTLTLPRAFAMLAVGDRSTLYSGRTAPLVRLFHALLVVFGVDEPNRKAGCMSIHMLRTSTPPYACRRANGGLQNSYRSMKMSKLALTFHNTHFNVIDRNGQIWLTSSEIANALGYSRPDSVNKIYERNATEFTSSMVENVKLTCSGNLQKTVRIFSLRGAHLIGMFARTPIAKEFRKWVLDVLEKEAVAPAPQPYDANSLTGPDLAITHAVQTLVERARYLVGFWHQYGPAIRMLNSNIADGVYDCFWDADWSSGLLAKKLGIPIKSREYFQNYPFHADSQGKQLYYLTHRGCK